MDAILFRTIKLKNNKALDEFDSNLLKEHNIAINMYKKMGFKIIGETIEILNNESMQFFKIIKTKELEQ